MLMQGAICIQLNIKFHEGASFLFVTIFFFLLSGCNSGVINKMLKDGSILTGKNMLYKCIKESCIPKLTLIE